MGRNVTNLNMKLRMLYQTLRRSIGKSKIFIFVITIAVGIVLIVINIYVKSIWLTAACGLVYIITFLEFILLGVRFEKQSTENGMNSKEFRAVAETLKDGLIIYDQQFRVLFINHSAEEIFNIDSKDVVGSKIEPKLSNDPKLRCFVQTLFPTLASSVAQVSESNIWPQIVEITTENPQLSLYTVLNKITDENGLLVYFLKLVRNETREQAILKSKNEFIGTAAHQLRTPLTAINWALENIKKISGDSSEIGMVADQALGVSERALKITNDLLDVVKIEEGKFGYAMHQANLIEFIENVVKTSLPFAEQKSIKLSLSKPDTNEMLVNIDEERLGLALFNLIDNAIKYNTNGGSVTVSIGYTEDGHRAKISVEDTGVGIDAEEIKKLFQKFYRGSNVIQIEPNGSGLGLFITRNIIRQHGGDIGVESNIGRGSTFWFTIPLSL